MSAFRHFYLGPFCRNLYGLLFDKLPDLLGLLLLLFGLLLVFHHLLQLVVGLLILNYNFYDVK